MYLYGCKIDEISSTIKSRYQCNRAIKLGSCTYYLANMALSDDMNPLDVNVYPVINEPNMKLATHENDEAVMARDFKNPKRRTIFVEYPIPEGMRLIAVKQYTVALRFNLNDNGKVCYVGREYPEVFTNRDNVVLKLCFQADKGKITIVKFTVGDGYELNSEVTYYGNDNTPHRDARNYLDCLVNDHFAKRVRLPQNPVIIVNGKRSFKRPIFEVLNRWLGGGLPDSTSIILANNPYEVKNVLKEIDPLSADPYNIMFFGFNHTNCVIFRNMLRNIVNDEKGETEE